MNKKINRTLCMILLCLLLPSTALVGIPLAGAHSPPWNIPTYAYVSASPNTVGVGQDTVIVMWLDKYPPTAGGLGGDLWHGYKLEITKPDGTKVSFGPYDSSTIASNWVVYKPDQAGDYKLVFSWPGQTLTNGTGQPNPSGIAYVGDYFILPINVKKYFLC